MTTLLADSPETATPSTADAELARESSRRLATIRASQKPNVRFCIQQVDQPEEAIVIPGPAVHLLAGILTEMAKGNSVTLLPIPAETTAEQPVVAPDTSIALTVPQMAKSLDFIGKPVVAESEPLKFDPDDDPLY